MVDGSCVCLKTETAEGYPSKTCRKALGVFYACQKKGLDYTKPMPKEKMRACFGYLSFSDFGENCRQTLEDSRFGYHCWSRAHNPKNFFQNIYLVLCIFLHKTVNSSI